MIGKCTNMGIRQMDYRAKAFHVEMASNTMEESTFLIKYGIKWESIVKV